MDEIYYHSVTVNTGFLYWLGWLLGRCKAPVHTAIYWKSGNQYWKTELTNDLPVNAAIIGRGDVYTIQVAAVAAPQGIWSGLGMRARL